MPLRLDRRKLLPSLRQVLDRIDRRRRARWNACAAVDAIVRIQVQLRGRQKLRFLVSRLNAVTGTNLDARGCL
jgi:hypothetical protein